MVGRALVYSLPSHTFAIQLSVRRLTVRSSLSEASSIRVWASAYVRAAVLHVQHVWEICVGKCGGCGM